LYYYFFPTGTGLVNLALFWMCERSSLVARDLS